MVFCILLEVLLIAEAFDFKDTNVILNEEKYDTIAPIDIYSVLVLSNALNCFSNYNTEKLIVKIPVLNEYSESFN